MRAKRKSRKRKSEQKTKVSKSEPKILLRYEPEHQEMPEETPTPAEPERINHPQHYGGDTTYEAIKVIEAWELGFCLGNAVKYICRAGKKESARTLEDLRKASWYLNREVEKRQKEYDLEKLAAKVEFEKFLVASGKWTPVREKNAK